MFGGGRRGRGGDGRGECRERDQSAVGGVASLGTVPEAYAWTRTICIARDCILRGIDTICVEWT